MSNAKHALLLDSGLFDEVWYLKRYPDAQHSQLTPLDHFLNYGWALGRCPGPGFDPAFYCQRYPDIAEGKIDPLSHFITHGRAEGRLGKPGASTAAEKSDSSTVGNQLKVSSAPAPSTVEKASLSAGPLPTDDTALLTQSALFDAGWYRSEYQDVASKGVDPVSHYLRHGAKELREPGPDFDTAFYLSRYPEVRQSGANPLVHYLREGQAKGYLPRPALDQPMWWEGVVGPASLNVSLQTLARLKANTQVPAIIIPVYNAVDEVADCLAALKQNTQQPCRVIIINDASPDPAVAELLAQYASQWPFECYHNPENLGFTRTVNRGLALAGRSDVVFLNSDTRVTPGWLRRLRLTAYSDEKIGTVTPYSNNAGAFSAPVAGTNDLPENVSLDSWARAIAQGSAHLHPEVPTGNGFCLYIRRDCLDAVGLLDAEAFPRGYGEENDFCMRAGQQGWRHLIDDATYIYHVRSASFGDSKKALMEAGRKVIDSRYPDYASLVKTHFSASSLQQSRAQVKAIEQAATEEGVKPRALYVLSTRTGGTPQTNQDLMGAVEQDLECFVLRCNTRVMSLLHFSQGVYREVERYELSQPIEALPHRSEEYDRVIAGWLVSYAFEVVHVRHIAWHSLGLLEVVNALSIPLVFSFHDFYTLCPSVKLLDEHQQFCAGKCTASLGECQHELWPKDSFLSLKHTAIKAWQREFQQTLAQCNAFVTTTSSARDYLQQRYGMLKGANFPVIPHGRDFLAMTNVATAPQPNEPLRIVFPGNISWAKGGDIIVQLAGLASPEELEIHILGKVASSLPLPANVVQHGSYLRDEFAERLAAIKPHVGGVLSIWPETFCHTLTELWASGLPVIGFDIGAVGDRIRSTQAGWLSESFTAQGVLDQVKRARDAGQWHSAHQHVNEWQTSAGQEYGCEQMGAAYLALYNDLWRRRFGAEDQAKQLSNSMRTLVPTVPV